MSLTRAVAWKLMVLISEWSLACRIPHMQWASRRRDCFIDLNSRSMLWRLAYRSFQVLVRLGIQLKIRRFLLGCSHTFCPADLAQAATSGRIRMWQHRTGDTAQLPDV